MMIKFGKCGKPMIEFNDYSFGYDYKQPFEKRIFTDVDLKIDGKKTLLVGTSGSGKSTFFKTLIKYLKPSNGTVITPNEIGFLLQNVNSQVICHTIYEEINLGYKNKFNVDIKEETIQSFFKLFEVNFLLTDNPRHLSGGQKKIIILIALLVTEPQLLLLDEPFVGLDYKRKILLIEYLKSSDINFILSTHDVSDSRDLFDQVVLIENKKLLIVELEDVYQRMILKRPVLI
jgi:energy-coupling factor transporter ATP-binding protein EcfA2